MLIDESAYAKALGTETDPFVIRMFRGVVEAYEAAKATEQPKGLVKAVIAEIDRLGAMKPDEIAAQNDVGVFELLDMAITLKNEVEDDKPDQPVGCAEQQAKEIIERIWGVWYGDHRGDMTPDRFATTLEIAKKQIVSAISHSDCQKCNAEMERVKACEHIAEGDMDGNDWRALRNICPSTMAVAELRDKYEALLMRESGDDTDYNAKYEKLKEFVRGKWKGDCAECASLANEVFRQESATNEIEDQGAK